MSLRLGDLQKNAKLNAWYETLQARKASGQSVDAWCRENGIVRSTYYYWQKKVREALEARLGLEERREHFVALPAPGEKAGEKESQAIRLRLGILEVEIPEGASRENIEAVIEALKC